MANLASLLRFNQLNKQRAKDVSFGASNKKPYTLTLTGITMPHNSQNNRQVLLYLDKSFDECGIDTNQTFTDAAGHPMNYIEVCDGGSTLRIQTIIKAYMTEARKQSYSAKAGGRADANAASCSATSGRERTKDDVVAEGDWRVIRRHHQVLIHPDVPGVSLETDDYMRVEVSGVLAVRNFSQNDPHTPFLLLVGSKVTVLRSVTYEEMLNAVDAIPTHLVHIPPVNFMEVRHAIERQRTKYGEGADSRMRFDATQSLNYADTRDTVGDTRFHIITRNPGALGDVQRFVACLCGDARDLFLSSIPLNAYEACWPTAIKAALEDHGRYVLSNPPYDFTFLKNSDATKEEKMMLSYKQMLSCMHANGEPSFAVVLEMTFLPSMAVAFMQISHKGMYLAFNTAHLPRMRNRVFASFPLKGALSQQQNGDTRTTGLMVLSGIGNLLVSDLAPYVTTYGFPVHTSAALTILNHLLRVCKYDRAMPSGQLDMRSFYDECGKTMFEANRQNRIRDPLVLNLLESNINVTLEQLEATYDFYVLMDHITLSDALVVKLVDSGLDLPDTFSALVINSEWFDGARREEVDTKKYEADDALRSKRIIIGDPDRGTKIVYAVKKSYSRANAPMLNASAFQRFKANMEREDRERELKAQAQAEPIQSNDDDAAPSKGTKRPADQVGHPEESFDGVIEEILEPLPKTARLEA